MHVLYIDIQCRYTSMHGLFWIDLNIGRFSGWEVRVKGDLVARGDNGKINTPPVTTMRPLVRLHYNSSGKLRIPGEVVYFCMYFILYGVQ